MIAMKATNGTLVSEVFKRCACGLGYTIEEFRELTFVGIDIADPEAPLELRNCKCGSTIAIELTGDEAVQLVFSLFENSRG